MLTVLVRARSVCHAHGLQLSRDRCVWFFIILDSYTFSQIEWDLIESNCFGVSPRKCSAIIQRFFLAEMFSGSALKSWHTYPIMRKTAGIWFWFLWILKMHACCQLSGQKIWTRILFYVALIDWVIFLFFSPLSILSCYNSVINATIDRSLSSILKKIM